MGVISQVKLESALLSVASIVILIFSGLSLFLTHSIYRTYSNDIAKLTEQYDRISENLTNLTIANPENKFIVLAWHEEIEFLWGKQIDVSSYQVGYLYYSTEAGSTDATLMIGFNGAPTDVQNVFPGTLYSMIHVQIGAPRNGVFKFDIQGQLMHIDLAAISVMEYDWIRTSLSLYLVS